MLRYALRPGRLVGLLGFLLLAFGFFGADTAHAQTPAPDWSPTFPRDGANVHTDVACKGERCVAVGTNGQIVVTDNAGFDWRTISSPIGPSPVYTIFAPFYDWLYTVDCPSVGVCYAGGMSGTVIKSVDAGETWNVQESPVPSYTIQALSCPTTQECYAAGTTYTPSLTPVSNNPVGFLIRTTDGGANWIRASNVPTSTGYSNLVCPAPNICYVGNVFFGITNPPSFLYKTIDGGATWINVGGGSTILECLNENVCFAASSHGEVGTFRTTDGGVNWRRILDGPVSKMDCLSADVCYALPAYQIASGQQAWPRNIYTTKDGGTTWQFDATHLNFILKNIACLDEVRCIAVGGGEQGVEIGAFLSPTIVGTVDGGKYWTKRNESIVKPLQSVSCPTEQICYTVGARGAIFKTTDSSFSWQEQSTPLTTTLFGISCPSVTFCVAVGDLGKIRYTTDGTNWNTAPAFNTNPLYSISCLATNDCLAVGRGGLILRMNGTPNSWVQENSGTSAALFSVSCPATGTCYATGENGTLLKKSGGTWTPQVSGSTLDLRSISCPAVSTCYVSETFSGTTAPNTPSLGGRVISTTNGTTWTASATPVSYATFSAIHCPNVTTCYVGYGFNKTGGSSSYNEYSFVISTTNGGATWTTKRLNSSPNQQALGFSCISANQCVAVGTNNLLAKIVNATYGVEWESQYSGFYYGFYDGTCVVGNYNCIVVGSYGLVSGIQTSQDNGATWRTTFLPSIAALNVSCPISQICYISGANSLLKTTNGGSTWQVITTTQVAKGGLDCTTADVCHGLDIYCTGSFNCYGAGNIWRSTDGGVKWTKTGIGYYNRLDCPSAQVCYAIGADNIYQNLTNYIYKTTDGGSTWNTLSSPVISESFSQLDCPSDLVCYILASETNNPLYSNWDYKILKTTDGGANWQVLNFPQGLLIQRFNTLSCATESHCLVGGVLGLFAATRNGGSSWEGLPNRTSTIYLSAECQADRTCRVFGEGGVILQGKLPACSLTVSKTVDDGSCGTLRAAVESAITGENIAFELGATPQPLQLNSNLTVPGGVNLVSNCATPKITVQGANNPTLRLNGSSRLEGWLLKGIQLQATSVGTLPNLIKCVQVQR